MRGHSPPDKLVGVGIRFGGQKIHGQCTQNVCWSSAGTVIGFVSDPKLGHQKLRRVKCTELWEKQMLSGRTFARACVCVCVCARLRVRAYVRASARARMCVCVCVFDGSTMRRAHWLILAHRRTVYGLLLYIWLEKEFEYDNFLNVLSLIYLRLIVQRCPSAVDRTFRSN